MLSLRDSGWHSSALLLRLFALIAYFGVCGGLLWAGLHPSVQDRLLVSLPDIFWFLIIPVIPIIALIATPIWRNICPLSALNNLSFRIRQSLEKSLPGVGGSDAATQPKAASPARLIRAGGVRTSIYRFLRKQGTLISLALLGLIVPLRLVLDDHNHLLLGAVLAGLAILAIASGVMFPYKSGWCSSICPLYSVEQMYAVAPLVKAENAQCLETDEATNRKSFCSGCVFNCLDRKVSPEDNVSSMPGLIDARVKALLSAFPGVVAGFNIAQVTVESQSYPILSRFFIVYGFMLVCVMISRFLYLSVEAHLLQRRMGLEAHVRLPRLVVAASLFLYLAFRIPYTVVTLASVSVLDASLAYIAEISLLELAAVITCSWYRNSLKGRDGSQAPSQAIAAVNQTTPSAWNPGSDRL